MTLAVLIALTWLSADYLCELGVWLDRQWQLAWWRITGVIE